MREHRAAGSVTRAAKSRPPAGHPRAGRTATGPEATDKPDVPLIEAKPAAPFQDL